MNVLALVDPLKKFRFISNGYGSNHDMRVFRNSDTLQNFTEGLSNEFFIVGDKAYRAIEKVRVPTIYGNITEEMKEHLGKQRIIVENAFGLFKNKFRRFAHSQKNGDSPKYMKMLIGAAIIYNLLLD